MNKKQKHILGSAMLAILCILFVGSMVYSIGILPAAGVLGVVAVIVIWIGISVNLLDS